MKTILVILGMVIGYFSAEAQQVSPELFKVQSKFISTSKVVNCNNGLDYVDSLYSSYCKQHKYDKQFVQEATQYYFTLDSVYSIVPDEPTILHNYKQEKAVKCTNRAI